MIKQLQGKLKSQSHQFLNWQRKFQFQVSFRVDYLHKHQPKRKLSHKIMFQISQRHNY